jgi:hypothetical protein
MVSILAISILTLGVVVLTSLLTVRSRVAAVTVEGVVLRAPATGVVAGELPPPGSSVHEGQPLFQILTADMTTKVAELSGEVNRLRVASQYSRARLREVKEVTSNLRVLSERKLDSVKAKIAALDTQISLYTKLVGNKQYCGAAFTPRLISFLQIMAFTHSPGWTRSASIWKPAEKLGTMLSRIWSSSARRSIC